MTTMTATDAKNKIGELWSLAEHEPVTIERNGVAKYQLIPTDRYIAVPVEEYARMKQVKRKPRFGCAQDRFRGFDTAALLAVDVSEAFEETS